MFAAFAKLRRRSLGPILDADASGWAVNGRAPLDIPSGPPAASTPRAAPARRPK